jgi:hypothetical protein
MMVSRMANTSSVPRRVLDRTMHGIWRQKGALLVYCGVVAAMVGYLAFAAQNTPSSSKGLWVTPDCADAVMAAVTGQSAPAEQQQQAYQCMGPELQHVSQEGR